MEQQPSLPFTKISESLEAKTNQQVLPRPPPNVPSNIWKDTHTFIFNVDSDRISEFDQTYGRQIEELKDEVKEMLVVAANDPVEKINLINLLCRLGVSYHFQAEIELQLNHIFESQHNLGCDNDYDLYTISVLFRVLRQHGYKMSCSNFNKFKDIDGKFNEILTNDTKGMLSLYEASHLRLHGEEILEEALAFSKAHLIKSLADEKSSPHLAEQIINALELPLQKSIPRLEALKFISFYEQEESRSDTLLLFAKLDFNWLQLLHQQELSHISSWWKDLDLPSKLPYVRDRVIEAYFWAVMIYFEPYYSRARLMLTKITMLLTVVDDTNDSYGTPEELQLLIDAIHRWDISALDDLPDYMKIVYSTLLNLFDEISNGLTEKERSYRVSYTKDKVKEMFTAYFVESQWSHQNYVPPFDEYYRNAFLTVGSFGYTTSSFLGMGEEIVEIDTFEWLLTTPKLLSASYELTRLKNDLMSHKFGEKREHVVCSVECYMNDYGLSMEEITEKFNLIFENAWKDINQECLKPTPVSMEILLRIVNLARLVEVTYKDGDGFTHPQHFKAMISTLFIDEIPI
ncbi:hypothetical protein EZV62_009195 [Acer yangbiense]|uniref:(+)-delta-cadinene synthase n=1 Tax=Acer yangbiense TaxID=1000413 RepID=A0A5C7IF00_9ROSI|nr:hypothetical protein EZV62_009195 [Acer yangbiense]